MTSYGRIFYLNHNTRTTTWERPSNLAVPSFDQNLSVGGDRSLTEAPLPPGDAQTILAGFGALFLGSAAAVVFWGVRLLSLLLGEAVVVVVGCRCRF